MGLMVFISYATKDSRKYKINSIAKKLEKELEIDQVLYWEEHMYDDIIRYMNQNLGCCDVVVVFCSQNAIRSESVQLEWMTALKLKKKIIPVFVKEEDIPPLLTTKLGVQFQRDDFEGTIRYLHQLILKKQKSIGGGEVLKSTDAVSTVNGRKFPLEEVAKKVARAIFNGDHSFILGLNQYKIKQYYSSKVRYAQITPYTFLEQNPRKTSIFGRMARQGKRIIWILKHNNYHARLIENEFVYL
ncbi:MAG: toll/interleukin-1 receptor domain-containing protein [Candidatus Hodarchaeota archaeon]